MRLRPSQSLAILLVLAAVFPPAAVVNLWIVGAPLQQPTDAKKPVQARARNRIGSTIQVEACRACSPLASGEDEPLRPSRGLPLEGRSEPKRLGRASRPHTSPIFLRLRC